MLIFDCETNGLLHELDRIHCLVIKDTDDSAPGTLYVGHDAVAGGLGYLMTRAALGTKLCGHNIIKFDVPALQKVYPWFTVPPRCLVDTIVYGRLTYPDLWEIDAKLKSQGKLPPKLTNRHSLEAWGHRLGVHKGDYKGGWETYSAVMGQYCVQDVEVTHALLTKLQTCKVSPAQEAVDLEMQVAWITARQEVHGFAFDMQKAVSLYSKLAKRRLELEALLAATFKPFYLPAGHLFPKRDNKPQGYVAGAALTKVKLTPFNPGSRDHIANRLTKLYGWKPTAFTPDGSPQIDETVLKGLPYPEAKPLEEYFLVEKRIGQLAEGKEACMKRVGNDGRMHGVVNTMGTVTGRMSHAYPNVAQTPASYSPYGAEFRACYVVPPGKKLVGADASALEGCCLAAFMAKYDEGAYVLTVTAGNKDDGTDVHSVTQRAIGCATRDIAKTWFYAYLYGAGDGKLGSILGGSRAKGKASRDAFAAGLPALAKLVENVKKAAKQRGGYLKGIDGRWLLVRSDHAALNTLLQSAGAVLMKRALVILDTNLQEKGYVPGVNYEFVANVHDEWQIESDAGIADEVGRMATDAIRLAGESFSFRCPLSGDYRVGDNWAETH